ncbi:hypothetical protein IV203_017098 [Nitzschia inconspicua]|uniref:Cysteinyl-tRNA ligase anticodon binding domain-containing protein n=1 Tax=Nitzschia inconspicua TaxID=303405 RepID=A0A9K3KSS1_9STRA|nr:hypothetical protein IV203_017098 [Nitzschia inconspicua]
MMMGTIFALAVLFLCFVLDGVDAFGVTHSSLSIRQKVVACVPSLAVQKDDAYEDFYAGFNPAEFENYNQGYDKPQPRRTNNRNANGHDYVRDWDADDSNVDVEAVNQLIAERLSMRKTGQFEEADDIRDRLLNEHGVLVRDKDKKWRSGCSRSGSGLKWLRASTPDRRSNSKPMTDYGPNGHDYVMAIDAGELQCKLSVEEINKLLADRLGRKLSRDYKGADKLQEELLKAGVFVNDRSREWRADGKSFLGLEPNQYTMSELSEKPDESMLEEIESLIKFRALLKAERLFQGADTVRDDLVYRYNVYVDDRSLQWSVGNPFPGEKKWGNEYVPFRMARSSQIPDEVEEIEALLEERDSARVNRNFKKADEIRDRLANKFNVYTNDKKRECEEVEVYQRKI